LLAASDLDERERLWALGVKSAAEHLAQLTTIVCDAARADAAGLALRQEPFSPRQARRNRRRHRCARAPAPAGSRPTSRSRPTCRIRSRAIRSGCGR
jgi:hypothetical protein